MAKPTTVDEYFGTLTPDAQAVLGKVRATLRKAVPAGEEGISYQIPVIKHHGAVFFFAAWKQHYSLYPVTESLLERFGEDLARFEVEKGTIRFPYSKPVPVRLITAMAKFRAQENEAAAAAKAAAKAASRAASRAKW